MAERRTGTVVVYHLQDQVGLIQIDNFYSFDGKGHNIIWMIDHMELRPGDRVEFSIERNLWSIPTATNLKRIS